MVKVLLILCSSLALISACKRQSEPSDEYETPYFFINGKLNNLPFQIKAGEQNYYLTTGYHSDSLNVNCFEGEFKENCKDCKKSLKLVIRNYKSNNENNSFIRDSAFHTGSYVFYKSGKPKIDTYKFHFIGRPYDSIGVLKQEWLANENSKSEAKIFELDLKPGLNEEINYRVQYANSCKSNITIPFNISSQYEDLVFPNFECEAIDKAQFIFTFHAKGNLKSNFIWDFGNGAKAKGANVYYGYPIAGNYLVKLIQIVNGDSSFFYKWVNVNHYPECYTNFNYTYDILYDNLNLSTISIQYTDEMGINYSSANITQDKNSLFSIDQTYDYLKNEKGQRTRMVSFSLNCLLSNGNKIIRLENAKGIMAVAFQE